MPLLLILPLIASVGALSFRTVTDEIEDATPSIATLGALAVAGGAVYLAFRAAKR